MRIPGARKLAAVAVPFALAAGALAFTVTPAQALQNCDTNTQLFAQAQAAEALGDRWTYVEEDAVDEGNYAEANLAYVEAGDAYRLADTLYAEACRSLCQIGPRGRTRPRSQA
jgi:hypothetical protein